MKNKKFCFAILAALSVLCFSFSALAQTPDNPPPGGPPDFDGPPPGFDGPPPQFGPGGFGPGGPGGPGGMMQQETKLVKQFDKDGDKRLNAEERKAAREFLKQQPVRRGPGGPGGPRGGMGFGGRENQEPPKPGAKLSPADVKSFKSEPLYDAQTLRTFFLEFEDADWEKQLAEFKNTDVEIPAKVTVDGKVYPDVGVHFHGMSSFMMVGEGQKRSLVLSFDYAHPDQQIGGYNRLNLLNSHEDPTFLHSVLSLKIAREYMPAPKANYARVVINGESWGLYVNQQHFNKDFLKENFGTTQGARWKVPGSPMGRGSLAYLGEDAAAYKTIYEIKTKDDPKSWADLIKLCKVLNETPADKLQAALAPLLDIDGALKFIAWDNALSNGDGYWTRTSDYSIYEDDKGRFHVIPYDANETFSSGGGFGFPGGPGGPGGRFGRGGPRFGGGTNGVNPPNMTGTNTGGMGPGFAGRGRGPGGGGGVELDPLAVANDASKPLISKLLAVPELRARYLAYVRDIAENWLDWNRLGPIVTQYQTLIADDVKADTRKLDSYEAFVNGISGENQNEAQPGAPGGGRATSLKAFAEKRRAYLLKYQVIKKPNS